MPEGVDGLLRDKTRPSRIPPLGGRSRAERVVARRWPTAGRDDPLDGARRWPRRAASASARCSASGASTACSRTGCASSSCPTTRSSPPSCATSSASTSIRRRMPSCCRSTRRARSRRSTAPSPACRMKKGRCGTMTHDYKRNGTTTLFAALNVLDGTVIGRCMQRHRHQEFIRFLNAIEAEVPAGKLIHVIARQLRHPQASQGPRMARPPSALDLPLHADLGLLAQRRRGLLRQAHQAAAQARRVPLHRRTSGRHQPLRRRDTTTTRDPSAGPRTQTKSSPPSDEGTKC